VAERGDFTPSEAGEGGQQDQRAEAPIVVAVGPAVEGHGPQCALGVGPAQVDLGHGMHLTVPLKSQAVTAACELPDIADRAAADQFGQLEDLGDGQDRAFGCCFASGSPDAAGMWTGPNDGAVNVVKTQGWLATVSGTPLPPLRPARMS
jgi:hypothetical protein